MAKEPKTEVYNIKSYGMRFYSSRVAIPGHAIIKCVIECQTKEGAQVNLIFHADEESQKEASKSNGIIRFFYSRSDLDTVIDLLRNEGSVIAAYQGGSDSRLELKGEPVGQGEN